LIKKYERCIIERYETPQTSHLPVRDRETCADSRTCTLASRGSAFHRMKQLAANGDAAGFESLMNSAILKDCMECAKHRKWHTKHTHCTMDCGGNDGIFQGPCFEACKGFVDITAFFRDFAKEIAKHAALFAGNFTGQGATSVAEQERTATFGRTVATNRNLVMPTDAEKCDNGSDGYYVIPEDKDLLDWKPAGGGPSWNEFLTGYSPPGTITPSTFLAPHSLLTTLQRSKGIGANEGRLRADLRAAAKKANPLESLCKSAAAFASGKKSDGRALADLAVTGRRTYAAFKARPPRIEDVVACLKRDSKARARGESAIREAAQSALERAYRVLTALRAGGWPKKCPERTALGYIAASGEDDQPHRPVNVPSAEFAQYDLPVRVGAVTVNTRFMVAQRGESGPSCEYTGMKLPKEPAFPRLASDTDVILFIHGMDSRLEEAMHLTEVLHKLGKDRNKKYAVIAMDMPTSGYADNLDYNVISPLNAIGRATIPPGMMGFAPAPGYKVPVLDFNENFIVAFMKTLEKKVPGVTRHLRVVVGGSMGGNLSMRLGRPRPDAPWIKAVVPWSPAGMWESKSDKGIEHIALALPWAFAGGDARFRAEQPWSRNAFFYGGFDWQGKAAFIINVTKPQAQEWFGQSYPCRDASIRLSRVGRYETYDANFRRWHWRLAAEQLIFSHRIQKRGQPLYASNTHRTLLMCGVEDTGGGLCEATRQVAADMKYTPGHALFLKRTGHSIHDERPNFLGRHIADFIVKPVPGISMELDTARAGSAISTIHTASAEVCRDRCKASAACRAYNFLRSTTGPGGRCALMRNAGPKSVNVDAVSGAK
jgi:pimeloyl-ACP methyl ester carboxylesterase